LPLFHIRCTLHSLYFSYFPSSMIPLPPPSPLFPYTTLFRSPAERLTTAWFRRRAHAQGESDVVLEQSPSGPGWLVREIWRANHPDRKSTRLNSITVASRMPSSA